MTGILRATPMIDCGLVGQSFFFCFARVLGLKFSTQFSFFDANGGGGCDANFGASSKPGSFLCLSCRWTQPRRSFSELGQHHLGGGSASVHFFVRYDYPRASTMIIRPSHSPEARLERSSLCQLQSKNALLSLIGVVVCQ